MKDIFTNLLYFYSFRVTTYCNEKRDRKTFSLCVSSKPFEPLKRHSGKYFIMCAVISDGWDAIQSFFI